MRIIKLEVDITPHVMVDEFGKVYPIKFIKNVGNFKIKEINIHVDDNDIVIDIYVPNVFHPQLHIVNGFESLVDFKNPPVSSKTCHVFDVTGKKFDNVTEERLTYLFLVHDYSGRSTIKYNIPEEFYIRL